MIHVTPLPLLEVSVQLLAKVGLLTACLDTSHLKDIIFLSKVHRQRSKNLNPHWYLHTTVSNMYTNIHKAL